MTTLRAGVVAVQGNVSEHADAVEWAAEAHGVDVEIVEIRSDGLVPDCDVLLTPGGELTTISRLLEREGIADEIRAHVEAEKPVPATCAGLIVTSHDAKDDRVTTFDLLDATVDHNAFGRQVDSSEAPLDVADLDSPFPAVFTRAPFIDEVGKGVEVLVEWDGDPVAVRDGPVVGMSFHPELAPDSRLYDLAPFDELTAGIDA